MITLFFSSRIVSLIMLIVAYIYLLLIPGRYVNFYLLFSNFLILLLATIFSYFSKNKPFSLCKIVMLFYIIFFGLAPLLEYKLSIIYWGGEPIQDYNYLIINIFIVLSLILYTGIYLIAYNKIKKNFLFYNLFSLKLLNYNNSIFSIGLVILSGASFFVVFSYYNFDYTSLFFRGGDFDIILSNEDKSIGLIVGNFFRPIIFNAFAVYFFIRKKINFYTILLFLLAIIGASPTALPRFATATLYMSIIYIFIWRLRLKGFYLNNLILIGFVFAFPFLNLFRVFSSWGNIEYSFDLDFFTSGHFDAYQQLVRLTMYGSVTYGYQLLGSIFFFIPRSIWPSKPFGSGQTLADHFSYSNNNIAMPLLGEGYVNFGWLGLFSFISILALVTAKLDKYFWEIPPGCSTTLFPLAYMQLIGLTFFIMRGDLISSISYTCGILASICTITCWLRITSFNLIKTQKYASLY